MNPIRICTENTAAIEAALKGVNGRANDHAYSTFQEIEGLAKTAETAAVGYLGSQKRAVGAAWSQTSGEAVNNTYARKAFSRAATWVRIERRATGWFLIDAKKVEIGQQGGGSGRLTMTQAQADYAVSQFRAQFSVSPPAEALPAQSERAALAQAIDAVLGEGAYLKMAGEVYTTLRAK